MKNQKGGLEPLSKVPSFKYTSEKKRKLFIGNLYPYAEYFINCVNSIPFNSYSYNGNCEYINHEDKTQIISKCSSSGHPLYFFTGGTVYEILHKKFTNVIMHDYCDATGDIDVALYPPKLTESGESDIFFLNKDEKINSFYSDFTKWTFEKMVEQIKSIQIINRIEHLVKFEIDDYEDIPIKHKHVDFGYRIQNIEKCYVVGFLNEEKTMFKIQVVCKIEDSGIYVIDHVIEMIIPLPEEDILFSPTTELYKLPVINTISINNQKFNIQKYNGLINDNIEAYIERKQIYGQPNESEFVHKSINHIARLFYLFELFYKNQSLFPINEINLLFLFGLKPKKQNELTFLYYYKIVDGKLFNIKVDTKLFLNAYLELIIKNTYLYNIFKRNNPEFFIDNNDTKKLHNEFVSALFNDDLFQPSGLLTFQEISTTPKKTPTPPHRKTPTPPHRKTPKKTQKKSKKKKTQKKSKKKKTQSRKTK